MIREILNIYTDNGLGNNNPTFKGIVLADYSAKFPRMGMPSLSATLMWPTPLDDEWSGKEYVTLRGERFYIRHTPSGKKDNQDSRYNHEIEFTSEFAEILGNTYFIDAVPDEESGVECITRNKPCTNNTTFKFYGTISEFVDRLNCVFRHAGIGDSILNTKTSLTTDDTVNGDGYCAMLDPYGDYDASKTYEFSFEDKYLWEAITEGYNKTEIPFERRGRKIIFGAVPNIVEHKFEYGHDNELLSVYHKNANAKVINRITMLGSSENIPYYYPNETEYGHISIAAKSGNNVLTADKVEIANMTQLLSRLNADSFAILGKYDGVDVGNAQVETVTYFTAFGDGAFTQYVTKQTLRHDPSGTSRVIPWHIRVYFKVTEAGVVECRDVRGNLWTVNTAQPDGGVNLIENVTPEKLTSGTFDFSSQLEAQEGKISLGYLNKGDYVFQFSIAIPNRGGAATTPITAWCYLLSVSMGAAEKQKTGYYWDVDGKKYDGVGSLGVKISGELTDSMIGDGFGWTASGRMPFQDHLIPTKYRNTLGDERFYNALNDTYTDPDTGDDYVFPNPFVAGAPSEYIHRNEELKPTIEGITNAVQRKDVNGALMFDDNGNPIYQLFGEIADIAYDADDNDALKSESTEDGDKNDTLKYEHSFFYIKLNIFNGQYGFDLFAHYSQNDPMTIQMRDGSCNGCKFKVQSVKITDDTGLETYKNPIVVRNGKAVGVLSEDGIKESDLDPTQQNTQTHSIWICVQKDASTFGRIYPNQGENIKPQIGDRFNIINIDLPQAYILAAEKRLEEDGIRFMSDNNDEKFTFDIQASRIYLAEHPEVLAQLDEYSKIKVKYNGKEYEQYVNQLTIDCKNNEALPNIGIDLTDTLAVGQSFVEQVAERASSLIANASTVGGNLGTGGGGLSAALAERRYLNKQKADRTPYKLASTTGFEVGEFVSGGSGGIFFVDPETGQTYIEADKLKVRMKAIFAELEVAKEKSIGGQFDITPGGGIDISYVEELSDSYRCYFKAKDEDKGADCRFVVGDQARCQESNISNGTSKAASNRYYWRLVTAVNNAESYIELSKTDCDTDSDEPMAGDTIVQLGNRNNTKRQSAIVLSTVDAFAPSVILYNGIDHYSLDGKAVVEYGVDKSKNPPEPFFNCYGRFFFGPKGGSSYLKFEPSVGKLIFSGEFINVSVGGKALDQYIKDVVPPVTQEDIEDYVNAVVDPKIEGLQNQIDGVIETWFYNGVPTLSNYPASEWNTEALKIQHLGDLYYDNDTGTAYRFSQNAQGDYYWNTITDDAITKALAAAQKAQDTADGKRKVFVSQPTNNDEYKEGDLWVNATYGTQYSNDILRCITPKAKGEAFNISHWTLASKYTDDSALNTFISEYESTIEDIQEQLDGKAQTWYQPTDPSSAWNTPELKAMHVGDLWYNTTNGTTWYWDGSQWKQQDVPDSVFDKIDGKADIFVSKPTSGYHKNDLWFLEAEYTLSDGKHSKGTLVVAINDMGAAWNSNDWAKKDRYTDDTLAQQAINEINGYAYIKEALKGNTIVNGGLVLSSLIKLGTWTGSGDTATMSKVYAGMNGAIPAGLTQTQRDRTIASWWGGDMVDRFNASNQLISPVPANAASALVRMDGTGYFAKGNILWNADGSGSVAGGKLHWDASGNVFLGSGITVEGGTGGDKTLASVLNYMNSLNSLLVPVDASGQELTWQNASGAVAIMAKLSFFSVGDVAAFGGNGLSDGGGSGSAISVLGDWKDYNANTEGYALSAKLGYDLRTRITNLEGKNYLDALNLTTSGSGNAVTAVSLSADKKTLTVTKGATFLTSHQAIRTLTIQKNGTTVDTFDPTATANKTINITDVASASTLSSHTGNTTVHITAAERTLWNTTATNLADILGSDANGVIDKWDEIVAFLDTYDGANNLATLLSNKADKTTQIIAGTGLTGGGTLAADRTLSLATSGVTAGTYTKLTVDAYGRATSGSNPTTLAGYGITDAYTKTDADNRYVNVSGDTMTGALTVPRLIISSTDYISHLAFSRGNYNYITAPEGGSIAFIPNNKAIGSANTDLLISDKTITPGQQNNAVILGNTSYRWKNVYSVLGDFSTSVKIGSATLTYNATYDCLISDKTIVSEKDIQAFGASSSSGGSGSADINKLTSWANYNASTESYVPIAKIVYDSLGLKLEASDLNGYATQSWVNSQGFLKQSSLNNYVTINTAQDITAVKTFKGVSLKIQHPSALGGSARGVAFAGYDGTHYGAVGTLTSDNVFRYTCIGWDELWYDENHCLALSADIFKYKNQNVLHAGNTKIENGVIKINGTSITPVTSLANYYTKTEADGRYLKLAGGTMANTNLVTNLNADLLDGYHAGGGLEEIPVWRNFGNFAAVNNGDTNDTSNYKNFLRRITGSSAYGSALSGIKFLGTLTPNSQRLILGSTYNKTAHTDGMPQYSYFLNLRLDGRLITFGTDNGVYYENQLAFLTDNVASATKLNDNTTYKAWGQTFFANGVPQSVSGNMTNVGNIIPSATTTYNIGGTANQFKNVYAQWIGNYTGTLNIGVAHAYDISITTDHYVGIGTTSPAYKLDVNGDIRINGNMTGVGSITASADITITTSTANSVRHRAINANGTIDLLTSTNRGLYEPNKLTWVIATNGTNTWLSLGNVGIGTTSPAYMLDVNGTVRATALRLGSVTLYDGGGYLLVDKTIVSSADVQAFGQSDTSGGGGGTIFNLLKNWSNYSSDKADSYAISAGLGYGLHNRLTSVESNYLSITTAAATYQPKGNYLTSHQTLNHIKYVDRRDNSLAPYDAGFTNKGVEYGLKYNSVDGLNDGGTFHGIMTLHPWSNSSGGYAYQLGFTANGNIHQRSGTTAWGDWKKLLDTANYATTLDNAYLKLTGGTLTGTLTIQSNAFGTQLNIARTTNGAVGIKYSNSLGLLGYIGIGGSGSPIPNDVYFTRGSDNNDTDHRIWHSGNDGSGSGLDADLLDGWHRDEVRKGVLAFTCFQGESVVGGYDLNTLAPDGGIIRNYGSPSYWCNAPQGAQYGFALHLKTNSNLGGMLFADSNHNGTTDVTRSLWWRSSASVNNVKTWGQWHQIAFTDSNVASATKLATARSINGTSFDGTGDITTSKWGTARNVYIQDYEGEYTGAATSVNGSADVYLKMPSYAEFDYLAVNSLGVDSQVSNRLEVTGVTELDDILRVYGAATLSSTLSVTGDITGNAALTVPTANITSKAVFRYGGTAANYIAFEESADGKLNIFGRAGTAYNSLGSFNPTSAQLSLFKLYIGTSLSFDNASVIYGSPAIAKNNYIWLNHEKTVGFRYETSTNTIHVVGATLVVDKDVQAFAGS